MPLTSGCRSRGTGRGKMTTTWQVRKSILIWCFSFFKILFKYFLNVFNGSVMFCSLYCSMMRPMASLWYSARCRKEKKRQRNRQRHSDAADRSGSQRSCRGHVAFFLAMRRWQRQNKPARRSGSDAEKEFQENSFHNEFDEFCVCTLSFQPGRWGDWPLCQSLRVWLRLPM